MEGCAFCKLAQGGELALFEYRTIFARLDIHPVSPGHILLIPKRHVATHIDLGAVEWSDLHEASIQATRFVENNRPALYALYEAIEGRKITEHSPSYCQVAIQHMKMSADVPGGYNQGFNQNKVAGQTVPHFHWHVIPRYDDDVNDPRGGIRNILPGMGNYYFPPGE